MARGIADDDMPLYPSEDQIARKVLGARARDWPAVAELDARKGLPQIDPVHGGRYWPAVRRFYDMLNGMAGTVAAPAAAVAPAPGQPRVRVIDMAVDGEENLDGAKATPLRHQRRERRPFRARA